ncbi:MAG: Ig-like domain-containing protein [Pirellulaceae bacterium]|nr:Ig-like domain-containing protein [Pirellulaceae bacterium]
MSLSDDGHIVAIGAPKNSNVGSFSGHTRIYQYDSNASDWKKLGIDIDGENMIDMSGGAVALSGDGLTVAVGAILNTGGGTAAGHARAFRYTAGAWKQLGPDIDAEKAGDASGASVSLSTDGNTVAIGAWGNDGANGENSGHVRIFRYNSPDNSWLAVGTDIDGEAIGDESGSSVAFSNDGNTISIGAISNLGNGNVTDGGSGHTRVYHFADPNNANAPPTLNAIANISIAEDASEQTVNLAGISAGTDETQLLRVTATSNNTNLVPDPDVDYASANATGTLTFTPVANQHGTATITVTVEDAGPDGNFDEADDNATVTRTFDVVVTAVNDVPTLDAIINISIAEDASEQTVNLAGISAGGSESQPLRVTVSSSNTDLIPDPTVTYASANATGNIAFTPVADQSGTATITVTVEDGGFDNDLDTSEGNATVSRSFDVIVTPVNDAPVITVLGEISLTVEGLRGGEYNDAGATAWDAEDGNLTNDMAVSGDLVNLGKRDTYIVRYDVQDSAEIAAAQQARTVTIVDTLPPVTTLRLDNQVIHVSDHTQIGVGGVTNTDPGQPQLTNNTSVGNATKLANPVYRDTRFKQPDGSDVGSRQDWTGRAAAGAVPDPELPTASAWDRLETPITVTSTFNRIDLDGTACTENCTVTEVDFSQRSTYLLEYDAHDQTGNHAEQVVFALILDDQTTPVITIAGGDAATVEFGSDWTLAESTAVDNIDGNLTADIRYEVNNVTAGSVLGTDLTYTAAANLLSTSVVAEYLVTMTVSDHAGIYGKDNANNRAVAHKAIAVRHTVNVLPTLDNIPKQTVVEDSLEQTIALGGVTPGGIEVQQLRVTASSSKLELIEHPTVVYTSAETTGELKFTPRADQDGTATITVTVEDGGLDNNLDTLEGNGTFSRTFDVSVTPVNDLPIAGDVTYRPLDNTRLNKDQVAGLATLVTDVDKDGLAFSVVAGPNDGQLVLNEDGSFHYTPDSNFNLTDSFSYLAHDGTADSNVGTVTLQVDTDYSWYNCREPRDVNADSLVTPLDVLWVINTINNQGSHPLAKIRTAGIVKPFLDVNRDAHATPLDALWVINYLNQRSFGEGEAASETPAAALAIDQLMSEQANSTIHPERASRAVTTGTVSQPVPDNTPYWQRVDETFDSIIRPARRSQLSDADSDRDELFEQSDWLDFLGEDEAF